MSYFITLEGPDGGGKTTQAHRLARALAERSLSVLLTREPGGSTIGDQIRKVLMSLDNTTMHPSTEFLLFSASRAQHVREMIKPHLDQGAIVISDRFYHSSLAYQGYGHRLDLEALKQITQFATGGLTPDCILLLDLPVEEGLARRRTDGSWNRLDAYQEAFHQRVRDGYHAMVAADPERWGVVDATKSEDDVHWEILNLVLAKIPDSQSMG